MQKLCISCTWVYFENAEIYSGGNAHPYMCKNRNWGFEGDLIRNENPLTMH